MLQITQNDALCDALREASQKLGITQEEIARKADLSYSTLANYKTGHGPTLRNARRLAKILAKDVNEIFPETALRHEVVAVDRPRQSLNEVGQR